MLDETIPDNEEVIDEQSGEAPIEEEPISEPPEEEPIEEEEEREPQEDEPDTDEPEVLTQAAVNVLIANAIQKNKMVVATQLLEESEALAEAQAIQDAEDAKIATQAQEASAQAALELQRIKLEEVETANALKIQKDEDYEAAYLADKEKYPPIVENEVEAQERRFCYDAVSGEFISAYTGTLKQFETYMLALNAVAGDEPILPLYRTSLEAKYALVEWIDVFISDFTGNIPDAERLSWATKGASAKSYDNNETVDPDALQLLQNEALEANENITDLVNKILTNTKKYHTLVSELGGLRRITFKRIDEATDASEYEAIVEAAFTRAKVLESRLNITE